MDNTIYGLFQKIVREHKTAPAIMENNRMMTFGELSDMTDMIADSFPDNARAVGIVMRHRAEMIASIVPSDKELKVLRVRRELSENLTDFMIPEFIVKMPRIPLNVNGKPDMAKMPVVMKAG